MKNRQNFLKKFEVRQSHVPRFNEECGVFGISGTKDAAALTALGLHALQPVSYTHLTLPTKRIV